MRELGEACSRNRPVGKIRKTFVSRKDVKRNAKELFNDFNKKGRHERPFFCLT